MHLETDIAHGLTASAARVRLSQSGPNTLVEARRRSTLRMLLSQFSDFMILLLVASAIISGFIGDLRDTLVILGIVVLNAAVGFAQEFRAERAMAALKRLAAHGAVVVRDGLPQVVQAEMLVRGDVVLLEAGNAIPADLRLVEVTSFKVGEAALTGESLPVEKYARPLENDILPLAERQNMAFKGTVALYGRARGVVVATGMNTELGHIAGMLEGVGERRTPLQRRLTAFGRQLTILALVICLVIFITGLMRGEPPLLILMTALSLAVAAIPEAMPAVVTVLLALGAGRMARAHALIRRLSAVETLGSVTSICSDKTGTLTRNEMRVVEAFLAGQRYMIGDIDPASEPAMTLLTALAVCNDVARGTNGILGDPTEVALWRAATEAGVDKAERENVCPRLLNFPFESERKRMTTVHAASGGFVAFTKGAPETVLARCTTMMSEAGEVALDLKTAQANAELMAQDGLRVLAVAWRHLDRLPEERSPDSVERDLCLLGFVGLLDPPREEVKAAVAICRAAGITPIMITGDHPVTACAIARQIGILQDGGSVMTGRELLTVDDITLRHRVRDVRVYARIDPRQKIRIVVALQEVGEIVAMTGDGVNDAPALARADIGVAMGKIGTDVARESASLILLDDNFATIVTAVHEGRRIYDNILKFIRFVVACNFAEILTIFIAPFLGLPLPLTPIQILWMNLVTDGLPGLALTAEPAEADIMRRSPRSSHAGLFAKGMAWHVIWVGSLMAAITLLTQAIAVFSGDLHWRTMTFTVLTLTQMWQVMASRSQRELLFKQSVFSNPFVLGAALLTFILQLGVIYLPPLNAIFDTAPLTMGELAVCLAAASIVFFAIEGSKLLAGIRKR